MQYGNDTIVYNTATELTIASDAVTVTQANHKLQPESGTADNLSTISGTSDGWAGFLYVSDFGTDTITIKHNVGNILCVGGMDIELSNGCVGWYSNGTKVFVIGMGRSPYVLHAGQNQFNPTDGATFYMGRPFSSQQSTATNRKIAIPRAGTITRIDVIVGNNAGTQGSSENGTLYLRLNNTTDTTLSSTFQIDQASSASELYSFTGLSIAVAVDDYVEFKFTTPTWVTNPTNVIFDFDIYVS